MADILNDAAYLELMKYVKLSRESGIGNALIQKMLVQEFTKVIVEVVNTPPRPLDAGIAAFELLTEQTEKSA